MYNVLYIILYTYCKYIHTCTHNNVHVHVLVYVHVGFLLVSLAGYLCLQWYLANRQAVYSTCSLVDPPLRNEEGSDVILLHELCSTHWRVRANQIAVFTDSYLPHIV